ncbi:MAG: DUF433 domain-containing protein [Bacteroidota bacterium]
MNSVRMYLEVNPQILGGKPVLRGTRVAVQTLFDYLADISLEDFLEGFPSVSKEQAIGVLELSKELVNATTLPMR